MSAGGEGFSGVWIILDLGIVSKLDTEILLPTQFGAYHYGSWEKLLGDTISDGEHIHPKDEKLYHIRNNQLVQTIEW